MDLSFTKRAGKYDDLTIVRGGATETIACPKQGIIPHDMVHFAVESVLAHHGFLSLVGDGAALAFTTAGGDSAKAIERLVEALQAELWGGRVSAHELLAVYRHACEAHGHAVAAVTAADIAAIRTRIDELTQQWAAVAENGTLHLSL